MLPAYWLITRPDCCCQCNGLQVRSAASQAASQLRLVEERHQVGMGAYVWVGSGVGDHGCPCMAGAGGGG